MTEQAVLRVGAVAAFGSAAGQLVPGVLLPDEGGTADDAVTVLAGSDVWMAARVMALAGVILTVVALTVVARMFAGGAGRDWAGLGLPLIVLAGGLASAHQLIAINDKALAESWATAPTGMRGPYLASFDASWSASNVLANGAYVVFGLYLLTLAAAMFASGVHSRRIGWVTATSALVVLVGIVAERFAHGAGVLVAVGQLLFVGVTIVLGVRLWRASVETYRVEYRDFPVVEHTAAGAGSQP